MSDKNNTNSGHYDGALLEDMNHKFDVILEYLQPLSGLPTKVDSVDERLARVEYDVKVIKLAVKDQAANRDR